MNVIYLPFFQTILTNTHQTMEPFTNNLNKPFLNHTEALTQVCVSSVYKRFLIALSQNAPS